MQILFKGGQRETPHRHANPTSGLSTTSPRKSGVYSANIRWKARFSPRVSCYRISPVRPPLEQKRKKCGMGRGKKAAIVLLGCSLSVAACSQDPNQSFSRTTGGAAIGALFGAGTGAAVSSKNRGLGALIGGLAGAAAGGAIGAYLDAQSEARRQAALAQVARQAERPSAPSTSVKWSNPSQNTSGTIRATSRPTMINGRRCIEVEEQITIQGQPKRVQEMRCQAPDGRWI